MHSLALLSLLPQRTFATFTPSRTFTACSHTLQLLDCLFVWSHNFVIMNRLSRSLVSNVYKMSFRYSSEWGAGSGKGGGSGGSVRDAGGSFGKMEAAREEEFFRRKQKEQLEKMKSSLDQQKNDIEKQIQEHEAELKRLQNLIKNDN